jgi:hypothetical protein
LGWCRGLHGLANPAHLRRFLFPALLRVAPYSAADGVRVVSMAVAATSLSGDPIVSFLHAGQIVHLLAGGDDVAPVSVELDEAD